MPGSPVTIAVTMEGVERLQSIGAPAKVLGPPVRWFFDVVSADLLSDMMQRSPVRTGNLRRSHTRQVGPPTGQAGIPSFAVIGATAGYAVYVEARRPWILEAWEAYQPKLGTRIEETAARIQAAWKAA